LSKSRSWLLLVVIIGAVVLLDQVTKRAVVDHLRVGETVRPIPALSPFFQITYSQNTGAAFGFLPQAGDIFLVIAVIVVLSMLVYYRRIADSDMLSRVAIGLICAGALGNALDRLEYGHVVDFIHYQIPGVISNVSNIADHAIVTGVILLFIASWRAERRERSAAEEAAVGSETADGESVS
jgi:signal peptidase II